MKKADMGFFPNRLFCHRGPSESSGLPSEIVVIEKNGIYTILYYVLR
jgi:hypothetical protein